MHHPKAPAPQILKYLVPSTVPIMGCGLWDLLPVWITGLGG